MARYVYDVFYVDTSYHEELVESGVSPGLATQVDGYAGYFSEDGLFGSTGSRKAVASYFTATSYRFGDTVEEIADRNTNFSEGTLLWKGGRNGTAASGDVYKMTPTYSKSDFFMQTTLSQEQFDTYQYPENGVFDAGSGLMMWAVLVEILSVEMKMNVNGALKEFDKGWVNINGQLREIDKVWTRINGVLKES